MADENTTVTKPKAPVSTLVNVAGQQFELRNISLESGKKLYNALRALPPQYRAREQADEITHIINTFQRVVKVASLYDIDPTELAKNWVRASTKEGSLGAAFSDQMKQAMGDLGSEMETLGITRESLAKMVGAEAMAIGNGATTIAKTAGLGATAVDSAINGTGRVWNLMTTMTHEGASEVSSWFAREPEGAKVFAAAVVALRYQAATERHALPLISMPQMLGGEKSQLLEHPFAHAKASSQWLVEWLYQTVPFAEYAVAAWKWLTNWGKDKLSFGQYVEQAKDEINAARERTPTGGQLYNQLVDNALFEVDGKYARDILVAAETIGGLKTAGFADAATAPNVTYENDKGEHVRKNGNSSEIVSTRAGRIQEAWTGVVGEGSGTEQTVRGGVAVASAVSFANNAAKGGVHQFTKGLSPEAEGLVKTVADWAKKPVGFLAAEEGSKLRFLNIGGIAGNALGGIFGWAGKKAVTIPAGAVMGTARTAFGFAEGIHEVANGAELGKSTFKTEAAGRFAGRVTTHAVTGTANAVAGTTTGTARTAFGFVEGVHETVNDAAVGKSTFKTEAVGRGAGKIVTRGLGVLAPTVAGTQLAAAVVDGDGQGIAIRGAEVAAMATTITKFGLKRAAPGVGAIWAGAELTNSAINGDGRGIVKSSTELGTMGAGAAIGAGIGVWFGGIGAVPGAIVGAGIGGIASIFTGWGAGKIYDKYHPEGQPETMLASTDATKNGLSNEALVAAEQGVRDQARAQQVAQTEAARLAINPNNIQLGAMVNDNGQPLKPTQFSLSGIIGSTPLVVS